MPQIAANAQFTDATAATDGLALVLQRQERRTPGALADFGVRRCIRRIVVLDSVGLRKFGHGHQKPASWKQMGTHHAKDNGIATIPLPLDQKHYTNPGVTKQISRCEQTAPRWA